MEGSDDPLGKPVETPTPTAPPVAVSEDVITPPLGGDLEAHSSITSVQSIKRAKRDDLLNKASLVLRVVGLLFSLLSFIIMATDKHTVVEVGFLTVYKLEFNFIHFGEYKYLLAVGILSTLYTATQVIRHLFFSKKEYISQRTSGLLDFFGDQIVAYLLVSAASTSIPITNIFSGAGSDTFTDSSAASISMAFGAYVALALCAMISGFRNKELGSAILAGKIIIQCRNYICIKVHEIQDSSQVANIVAALEMPIPLIPRKITRVRWKPPELGEYKVNSDGSLTEKAGGYGGVVRNSDGDVLMGFSGRTEHGNIFLNELEGLSKGVTMCLEFQWKSVWFELDSINVVNPVLGSERGPWYAENLIVDIKQKLRLLDGFRVTHTFREGNSVADFCWEETGDDGGQEMLLVIVKGELFGVS